MVYAKEFTIRSENIMCAKNSTSMFCETEDILATPISTGSKDPYMNQLTHINSFMLKHWKQTPEPKGTDEWRSFIKEFEELSINDSTKISGDCEDLAMSAVEYAILKGIPKERLGRIIVKTYPAYKDGIIDEDSSETHMTAYYYSPELKAYFYFGDSYYDDVVRDYLAVHVPIAINWVTDGKTWIKSK